MSRIAALSRSAARSTLIAAVLSVTSASLAGVPSPTITRPNPASGPAWSPAADPKLAEAGYVEEEFFIEGVATSYTSATALTGDGLWTAVPAVQAPYKTRILVRRPVNPKRFNGTAVVEWLNVTAGVDSAPDWTYPRIEILRKGFAWVGVSAQWVGVEAPGPPAFPGAPNALKLFNPARYGSLNQPGDSFSYDIFSQAGQALRTPGEVKPLGGLRLRALIGDGESQSAGRMVTYVNGVHPVAGVFDAFLIHSRSGGASALSQVLKAGTGSGATVPATTTVSVPTGTSVLIRSDLATPVIVVQSETDIPGSVGARRADDASFRLWELAGTAHVDAYVLTGGIDPETITESICDLAATPAIDVIPVNAGPHTYSMRAALRHLDNWLRTGTPPPSGNPITTVGNVVQRDPATGIALGGIRLPQIDAPKWTLRGDRGPGGNFFCFLFGATDPWNGNTDAWDGTPSDASPTPEPDLAVLYPTHADYVSAFVRAAEASVQARFLLKEDLREVVKKANNSPVP